MLLERRAHVQERPSKLCNFIAPRQVRDCHIKISLPQPSCRNSKFLKWTGHPRRDKEYQDKHNNVTCNAHPRKHFFQRTLALHELMRRPHDHERPAIRFHRLEIYDGLFTIRRRSHEKPLSHATHCLFEFGNHLHPHPLREVRKVFLENNFVLGVSNYSVVRR